MEETPAVSLPSTDLDRERASFGRRLVALIIDSLVVGLVGGILAYATGTDLVEIPVSAAYFTYFHGRTGQTPGNAALGVRVIDFRDGTGKPIGYGRALTRWLVSIVSALCFLLGYLWMLWDGENQTWHDKAAGSVVVKLESY
jgi:uncharacterized RDD family membrane protein YckC